MSKSIKLIILLGLIGILLIAADYIHKANLQTAKVDSINFCPLIRGHFDTCPTCQYTYIEPIYFLNCNTGELHELNPITYHNESVLVHTVVYDRVGKARLSMWKDTYSGTSASVSQKREVLSKPCLQNIFCDTCRQKIYTAIDGQRITSFVIFLPPEQAFYSIADGLNMQIDNRLLSVRYNSRLNKMDIDYYK